MELLHILTHYIIEIYLCDVPESPGVAPPPTHYMKEILV